MIKTVLCFLCILCAGCRDGASVRQYTQIELAPIAANAQGGLAWTLPRGWMELPASQMRLASFQLASDPNAFDCSIVSLPGGAGGLEANLRRWMEQIKLNVSDEVFDQFMRESQGNIFDFSKLQDGQGQGDESMIAAMLQINGATVFVKLKASIASVKANKAAFLLLVKSIRSQ